jgi:DNA-binding MarR family transcriptional regulator
METLLMDPVKSSISEDQIETQEAMLQIYQLWFNLGHGVPPISYMRAFALVAKKEGLTVDEYAAQAGISSTVMTRNLLDIGPLNRHREKGLDLIVKEQDPMDLRKQRSRLTPKGRKLAHDMDLAARRLRRTKG